MNNKKFALTMVILCLSVSAIWAVGAGQYGKKEFPISLTEGVWSAQAIDWDGPESELWFSFNVTRGSAYNIWWDDYDADEAYLDVKLDASYLDGPTIFTEEDWYSPYQFTANRDGTVLIRVYPYWSGEMGSFRISYSDLHRPSTAQPQQQPQQTGLRGGYYYLDNMNNPVEGYTFYRVTGTNNSHVLYFYARFQGENVLLFEFTGSSVGTSLNLQVSGINRNNVISALGTDNIPGMVIGHRETYTIVSNTSFIAGNSMFHLGNDPISSQAQQGTRGARADPIPLTENIWVQGAITSTTTELWFSFRVENRGDYYICWRDADTNSGLLDIMVDSSYQNGPGIFTQADYGGTSSEYIYRGFKADRNGTVLVRVYPLGAGRTGNFSIRFYRSYI